MTQQPMPGAHEPGEPGLGSPEPAATVPTPVRCPAIEVPHIALADPAGLDPLLARLAEPAPVSAPETFALGTLCPDGRVDLCKQGLGPRGVARVLPAAVASPHARHLLLGTNAMGTAGSLAIAEALRPGHGVETLYLGCNKIGPDGAAALARALADDGTVRALWLKRNPVGDTGVRAIAGMLRRNTTIRTLDLVNTGLTDEGLRALLAALADRPVRLERIFLGGNGLGPGSAALLAALISDAGVREVFAAANHLGDTGARALAGAVAAVASAAPVAPVAPVAPDSGGTAIRLGLGGNGIGPEGARALAGALRGIESLDLGRPPSERSLGAPPNATGDAGASALAAALPGSPLRRLELRHSGITGRGAKALLAEVSDAPSHTPTRLEYVGLGPGVPRKVKRAIAQHLRPAGRVHPDVRAIASVYR